ncbi:MAG: hypothetical protein J0L92_03625 [Deltaproteobacteria bacterium]|nr:hypothetical protein [Deltaproteobacteria bacterium]
MTLPWALLSGERITRGRVSVPGIGVWSAEIEMEGAPSISGSATLALGDLRLTGTIDESRSGSNAMVRRVVLVGGGGGWSKVLPARSYHSDAGVRASTVAQDAAREAGETLGTVRAGSDMLGSDYVRSRGPASVTIADIAAGVPWFVDFDGVTHVMAREEEQADVDAYEVLEVDPAERLVTLAVDDLTQVGVGSILTERLDAPLTIRAMEIEIEGGSWTVRAWCGAASTSASRLARALTRFVDRVRSDRLLGVWSYQVVRQNVDGRLEVQPVERSAGLPDIGPVSVWPGIAGASCEVAAGAQILVEFIDGDRRKPIVRGFAPKGGSGHIPSKLVLDASGASASLLLGAGATKKLAYAEDVAQAFSQVQATINAFVPGSGGASFPTPFVAPTASAIGTSKVVGS